jgi:hypothetical protein
MLKWYGHTEKITEHRWPEELISQDTTGCGRGVPKTVTTRNYKVTE